MAVSLLVLPKILLLSGQFFEQLILGLGLTVLTVIFGLTTFIFIRIFINWLQTISHKNRQNSIPQVKNTSSNLNENTLAIDRDISKLPSADIIDHNLAVTARFYQPIALWYGRLILPSQEQRPPHGSVFFEVFNAPKKYQNLAKQHC